MVHKTKLIHPVAGQRISGRATRHALPAALLIVAALASSCAYVQDQTTVGAVPDDYRTRHPIVVHESETKQDIIVSINARKLSLREQDVVRGFAASYRRSGAKEMAVLVPTGSPNEAAARRLAREATDILRTAGIAAGNIRVMHYAARELGDAATIRLAYGALVAEVLSQCGQWPEDMFNTVQNENYYNFGCATQKNLAAMVANPADLVGPRAESEIDATRRTNVINDWQQDGTAPLRPLF
jgi:pilus assembly protein CpaD